MITGRQADPGRTRFAARTAVGSAAGTAWLAAIAAQPGQLTAHDLLDLLPGRRGHNSRAQSVKEIKRQARGIPARQTTTEGS